MSLSALGRAGALALLLGGCAAASPPAAPPPPAGAAAPVDVWAMPELPPGAPIPREEYAARRAALAARLSDGVLLVMGGEEPDADYLPFAQRPHFRYLTGIEEPGAALLMVKRGDQVSERLFVRPRNPAREVWEGPRLGTEGAQALTGVPTRTADQLPAALDSLLRAGGTLYTPDPPPASPPLLQTLSHAQQVAARLIARYPGVRVASVDDLLQELRAPKSPRELDLLRRAIYITSLAHRAAMRTVEPGMNEFEIQALIEYSFRRHGADRPAFATIVGSGPNSTTLHYRADDRFFDAGEVIVMDVGASYRGYAADVTRTVPVSGRFSPEQRAVYEIVLAAQKAAESLARPGASWEQLNAAAERVLAQGLAQLGLIESPTATYRCDSERFGAVCPQYRLFYMHGLGHGIGLEVHDPDPSYFGTFRVGSAFSIEPGVYVRADALDHLPDTPENRAMAERLRPAVQRYQNIGVRIEDDYFITENGVERISAGAPREIEEIEALMRLPGVDADTRRPAVVEWYRQTGVR